MNNPTALGRSTMIYIAIKPIIFLSAILKTDK
jgi:hypothetical protein